MGAAENWPDHGGAHDESGYSRLDEINKDTIDRLGLAWSLDLEGEQVLEATPLAVNGVLYFTGSYSAVYAVDAVTGALLWKHDAEVWKHNPAKLRLSTSVNRGAAHADGRVFAATLDGRVLALDAKTGELLWSVETVERDDMRFSTGAPRTFNGKVIIGNGGGDYGERGYVTAYDQETGEQVWRFYTVPGSPEENEGDRAMERAAETWTGEYWKTGTGGAAWNGITFDPELNHIYIGGGNSGPYDPAVRSPDGGDNLYLVSIIAVDADTGEYVWHYQMNPREAWDYKAAMNMISATLEIDGRPRKVLMQSPTNGFFYVLDRETGELLSAEKTGKVNWAERIDLETGRPVEAPNIRYETGETIIRPSGFGTHNWQAMSFSPQTDLAYIPYMQLAMRFTKKITLESGEAAEIFGPLQVDIVMEDERDGKSALLAWDPIAQEERWRVWHDSFWNGGTLATAGGIVFQGTADGYFSAYDASSGERLWRYNAGLGIISAPISYFAGGKQYVSVLVGYGGPTFARELMNHGWKYGLQPRRLLTFAVDETAELPPTAPPDFNLYPVDDPAIEITKADAAAGGALYARNCGMCHGRDLVSPGNTAPDLRESGVALDHEGLWAVLHDGALIELGMPRFDEFSREQANQLYAYIRAGAREALLAPAAAKE